MIASNAGPAVSDQALDLESVALERLQVAAQATLTPQVLADAKLDVIRYTADQLLMRLESYVLAQHLADHTETATVRVPASWWDHWKDAHPRVLAWSVRMCWTGKGHHKPRFGRRLTRWLWL